MFHSVICHAAACQVHPDPQAAVVDIESRIVSASAYSHVPMTYASLPIGIAPRLYRLFLSVFYRLIRLSALLPSAASANFGADGTFASAPADQPQTLPPGVPQTWAPEYGEPQ
jgi:hypothetical protein